MWIKQSCMRFTSCVGRVLNQKDGEDAGWVQPAVWAVPGAWCRSEQVDGGKPNQILRYGVFWWRPGHVYSIERSCGQATASWDGSSGWEERAERFAAKDSDSGEPDQRNGISVLGVGIPQLTQSKEMRSFAVVLIDADADSYMVRPSEPRVALLWSTLWS